MNPRIKQGLRSLFIWMADGLGEDWKDELADEGYSDEEIEEIINITEGALKAMSTEISK